MQIFYTTFTIPIPMKLVDWIKSFIECNKIRWWFLSSNPNAIHLLEQNMDKIGLYCLKIRTRFA